jgi:hypothetical protein
MISSTPHAASLTKCRSTLPRTFAIDQRRSYMTAGRSLTPWLPLTRVTRIAPLLPTAPYA